MAKAFGDAKLAKKFDSLPLSNQTLHRRVIEQAEKSLVGLINKEGINFSLCLDEMLAKQM